MAQGSYIIVSPVRNEAKHLPGTIASVVNQTVLPVQWIIVDDGSTDGSIAIVEEAVRRHSWIQLVKRVDRGSRKPGTGVIEAFYDGYREIQRSWEYLVKLDGDVTFDANYFERCFQKFADDPRLGIGGGTVCNIVNGKVVPESKLDPAFHVRGATKIYRKGCWDQIGELIRAPGWDTLDELKANMLNWSTLTFGDIQLLHHKPAGSADGSWTNWVKNGFANYLVGYHPAFMICKSIRRLVHRPYGIQAVGLLFGFFSGYFKGIPHVPDRELIAYLRKQQLRKMFLQSSLWS